MGCVSRSAPAELMCVNAPRIFTSYFLLIAVRSRSTAKLDWESSQGVDRIGRWACRAMIRREGGPQLAGPSAQEETPVWKDSPPRAF